MIIKAIEKFRSISSDLLTSKHDQIRKSFDNFPPRKSTVVIGNQLAESHSYIDLKQHHKDMSRNQSK